MSLTSLPPPILNIIVIQLESVSQAFQLRCTSKHFANTIDFTDLTRFQKHNPLISMEKIMDQIIMLTPSNWGNTFKQLIYHHRFYNLTIKHMILFSILYKHIPNKLNRSNFKEQELEVTRLANICCCGTGNTAYQIMDIIGTTWVWFIKYRLHWTKCNVLNCLFLYYKSTMAIKLRVGRAEFYFNLYMLKQFVPKCVDLCFTEQIHIQMTAYVFHILKLLCPNKNSEKYISPYTIYGFDDAVDSHELMFQFLDSSRFRYLEHGSTIFSSWIGDKGKEAVKLGRRQIYSMIKSV